MKLARSLDNVSTSFLNIPSTGKSINSCILAGSIGGLPSTLAGWNSLSNNENSLQKLTIVSVER